MRTVTEEGIVEVRVSEEDILRLVHYFGQVPAVMENLKTNIAEKLREFAVERTAVDTGALKGSWSEIQRGEALVFHTGFRYGGILEEGLYPGVGPKTVAVGGKIYSKQSIGGIVLPIIDGTDPQGRTVEAAIQYAVDKLQAELDGIS